MPNLGEFYSGFTRIDLDTRGGYARVAEVRTTEKDRLPEICAFKVMRHEISYMKGAKRFEEEQKILVEITNDNDKNVPPAIIKIFDSGFVPMEVSIALAERETPNSKLEIVRTGLDIQAFQEKRNELEKNTPNKWLPYLAVELAPYNNSLLRQIRNQPPDDHEELFRLSTGEVIIMALQLLDTMKYLHEKHGRAYMDWKPEHVHWDGENLRVKLIDWNVTTPLSEAPGREQNIRDELRLFCAAVLYVGMTFVDPDDPAKPIGPRPTKELAGPIHELRRRYLTDKPVFYKREVTLDETIKEIISKGLHPRDGFESIEDMKKKLIEYAKNELGITEDELTLRSEPKSPYLQAIINVRAAQRHLYDAQEKIIDAVKTEGSRIELTRLFDAIKRALRYFPTT